MSAQKTADVDGLLLSADRLRSLGHPTFARIVDGGRAELIDRRNRDAAVERLVSAAERLAAAADDMALRKNDGGADPSIREVLEAVADVRGGA